METARKRLLAAAAPVAAERVPLQGLLGRYIRESVTATEPIPHFRRAGMDGFAVRAEDTADAAPDAPVRLAVVGTIACGHPPDFAIRAGEAARIMTGGMVPEGADAVVMLEAAEERGDAGTGRFVVIRKPIERGRNVGEAGSDAAAGVTFLTAGERIGPAEIALLASAGRTEALVGGKPRAGILATGSELLPPGSPLVPGKVRNSNSFMLAAQVAGAGGEPVLCGALPDDADAIERAVAEALSFCDLLITIGGVSVGDFDHIAAILQERSDELLFNKIMMRPGSVTSAAVRGGKPVLALSGNPGACFVGFELFGRPLIAAMQGCRRPAPVTLEAVLAAPFGKPNAYPRYVRGRWWSEGGRLYAAADAGDKSSRLLPGAGAGCLVEIPPGSGAPEGTVVSIIPLQQ